MNLSKVKSNKVISVAKKGNLELIKRKGKLRLLLLLDLSTIIVLYYLMTKTNFLILYF